MSSQTPKLKLTDTEWTVMNAVWSQSPASVRDVWEQIAPKTGWAYTTVKTMLTRLVEKGALATRKRANVSLFEPVITRDEARRAAIRSLLDRAFDGTFGSLVQHLVKDEMLSEADRARLAMLLQEDEAREKESPP